MKKSFTQIVSRKLKILQISLVAGLLTASTSPTFAARSNRQDPAEQRKAYENARNRSNANQQQNSSQNRSSNSSSSSSQNNNQSSPPARQQTPPARPQTPPPSSSQSQSRTQNSSTTNRSSVNQSRPSIQQPNRAVQTAPSNPQPRQRPPAISNRDSQQNQPQRKTWERPSNPVNRGVTQRPERRREETSDDSRQMRNQERMDQQRRENVNMRRDQERQTRSTVPTVVTMPNHNDRTRNANRPGTRLYDQTRDNSKVVYINNREQTRDRAQRERDRERDRYFGNRDRHDDHNHGNSRHERPRFVDRSHRHGSNCGHFHYENRWHDFPRSHSHHNGCGHHLVSGLWVSFSIGHTHGPGCGHFFDSGIWLGHTGSYHLHRTGCGHYYYSGLWHTYPRRHTHFNGCGHYLYNDFWHDYPQAHTHSNTCGHVYDGATWIVTDSGLHNHGPGCGHHFYDRTWHVYPRIYYTMYRQSSFFFFLDLGDYVARNLPEYVYEQHLDGSREIDILDARDDVSKAYAAFSRSNYYDSLLSFNRAIKDDPENGLLYLGRAQASMATSDYRSAYDDLVRGMELIPEWVDVDLNLTELYSNTYDLQEHTKNLEIWVERYPRDFKAHFVLGYFYYFQQDYVSAKEEMVYTLSWDKDHEQANAIMDRILSNDAEAELYEASE